jgi:hypothetical protein
MTRPCGQVLFLKYAKLGFVLGSLGTIKEVEETSPPKKKNKTKTNKGHK